LDATAETCKATGLLDDKMAATVGRNQKAGTLLALLITDTIRDVHVAALNGEFGADKERRREIHFLPAAARRAGSEQVHGRT
jgi:hypothetical protein